MVCDTVYRFRCIGAKVLPVYLELALNAPQVQSEIDTRKAGINDSGVSLTHNKIGASPYPYHHSRSSRGSRRGVPTVQLGRGVGGYGGHYFAAH